MPLRKDDRTEFEAIRRLVHGAEFGKCKTILVRIDGFVVNEKWVLRNAIFNWIRQKFQRQYLTNGVFPRMQKIELRDSFLTPNPRKNGSEMQRGLRFETSHSRYNQRVKLGLISLFGFARLSKIETKPLATFAELNLKGKCDFHPIARATNGMPCQCWTCFGLA